MNNDFSFVAYSHSTYSDLWEPFFDRLKSINPSIQTEGIESNAFHDRFMLADGQRGAFIGTSLNGIGRKYALIDYMRDEDAQEIYAAYQAEV